jgi:hypothetical protein
MIEKYLTQAGKLNNNLTRLVTEAELASFRAIKGLKETNLITTFYCIHHNIECKLCETCSKELSVENFQVGWNTNKRFCSISCKASYKPELSKSTEIFTNYAKLLDINGIPSHDKINRYLNQASIHNLKIVAGANCDDLNTNLFFALNKGSHKKCKSCDKTLHIDNFISGYRENQNYCSYECKDSHAEYKDNLSSMKTGVSRYASKVYFENYLAPWWEWRTKELLDDYGVECVSNIFEHNENSHIDFKCCTCKRIFKSNFDNGFRPSCSYCNKGSKPQYEILKFIESLGFTETSYCDRIALPSKREIDVYLPDLKIGFEHDGLWFHKDNDNSSKYLEAESLGIKIVKIFSNEWSKERSKVESKIRIILGKGDKIYARKCSITEITSKEAKEFYDANHMQKGIYSSVNYGLFYENVLVAAMSFSKSRFDKSIDWELTRYSSVLNTSVIGGASKLFSHFKKLNTGSVVSYCDLRYGTGNLYKKLGFNLASRSGPNYKYFKKNVFLSRYECQKHKIKSFLEKFDDSLTEHQNMVANGWIKIFDLGNDKFVFKQ